MSRCMICGGPIENKHCKLKCNELLKTNKRFLNRLQLEFQKQEEDFKYMELQNKKLTISACFLFCICFIQTIIMFFY